MTLRGRILRFHTNALAPNTLLVTSMTGREAISEPYRFEVDLVSTKADLDAKAILTAPAHLGVKQGVAIRGGKDRGVQTLKIHGMVETFRQSEKGLAWVAYRAVIVPQLWKLSLNVRNRVFLDKSVPEIVEEVLKDAGLSGADYEMSATGRSYPKREYVVQYRESDLNFVQRLCEHEGIFYFFTQEDDREKAVFADSASAHPQILGESTVPYRSTLTEAPAAEEGWFTPEAVKAVHCDQGWARKEVVLQDYNYRTPAVDLKVTEPVVSSGSGQVYEYGNHYKDQGEGKALAKVRAEELRCRERVFRGTSRVKSFRAGATYTLSEHYRGDFNADYLIVEVRHRAEQDLASGAPMAPIASYENEFESIPADVPFRPARRTPKPRVEGMIHGRVDAAGDGKYAELDDHGRYKVTLPFDLSGRKGGKASRFIRMAQPYAGAGMGMHFPLHKGTEVLLAHTNGDPDRPIIVASIPNPETASPVKGANQTQCVIHTGGNNAVVLEDLEGQERFFLQAQKDEHVRVKGSVREWVGKNRHLVVKGSQLEHVEGDRHDTVDGDHREVIGTDRHVTVKGKQAVKVEGGASLSVGGQVVEVFKADHSETTTGCASVKAKTLVFEASQGITLKCGASSVVVDAAGVTATGPGITLDGKATKINSGSGSAPAVAAAQTLATPAVADPPLEPGSITPGEAATSGAGDAEEDSAARKPSKKKSWIEIELVDEEKQPVAGEKYRIELPDGSGIEGTLSEKGLARVEGIDPGTCKVTFPNLDSEAWE